MGTAFPAYCDAAAVCSIISLEGLRAIEIRRTKTMPHGYRVRLFHEEGVDVNLNDAVSNLLDLQSLYNMGFDLHPRPNTGGGASIAFTPDESQQMRAGEACVKFVEDATKNLALKLDGEENTELLQKAICFAGERFCSQILERTMEVEANGGMMTRNQERRRTPGGVFFSLLKREISPDLSAFIFGEAPEEKEPGAIAIGGSSISDGMSYTPPASSSLNAHSVEFKAPLKSLKAAHSIQMLWLLHHRCPSSQPSEVSKYRPTIAARESSGLPTARTVAQMCGLQAQSFLCGNSISLTHPFSSSKIKTQKETHRA